MPRNARRLSPAPPLPGVIKADGRGLSGHVGCRATSLGD